MVTFADQYKSDVANILADGMPGVISITYTPAGCEAVVINALDGSGCGCEIRDDETGETLRKSRDITISTDSQIGVEDPSVGDIVNIESEQWKVVDIVNKDAAQAKISIVWSQSESKHNDNHKRTIS